MAKQIISHIRYNMLNYAGNKNNKKVANGIENGNRSNSTIVEKRTAAISKNRKYVNLP